jgi:hypothetical protein
LEVVYTKTDITKYGIYKLVGSVKRNTVTAEDDGIIYYYDEYSRSTYLTQTTSSYEVSLGNTITITATGPEEGNYTFAFYREDASGWVLMRDYSSDNVLEWTPLKKGVYKIQVRIKADDAGSYENAVTKVYTITSGGLAGELDVNVFDGVTNEEAASYTTGVPYKIVANYIGEDYDPDEDVLYMFTLQTANKGLVYLTKYSTNNSILFVPNKNDTSIITVRAIYRSNFGYKDISTSITIQSTLS